MFFKKKRDKKTSGQSGFTSQKTEFISQTGKTFEEIAPYLLSGEADDLPEDSTTELS